MDWLRHSDSCAESLHPESDERKHGRGDSGNDRERDGRIPCVKKAGQGKAWCRRRDLNPHGFPHTPLKRACLPFHHFGTTKKGKEGRGEILAEKEAVCQIHGFAGYPSPFPDALPDRDRRKYPR